MNRSEDESAGEAYHGVSDQYMDSSALPDIYLYSVDEDLAVLPPNHPQWN
jgi:hypothetical protein